MYAEYVKTQYCSVPLALELAVFFSLIDEFFRKVKMVPRDDKITAFKVDIAVNMMKVSGVLAAARFLDKQQVPVDVSLRVLGQTPGGKREVINAVSSPTRQDTVIARAEV